jgi:acyl-CoA synthetase (NDP forming)
VRRDPQWGHVIALGLGGVWIEALKDVSLRLLPVTPADVSAMLAELRGAVLLDGFRGAPAVDRALLADAVARIGQAALALGDTLDTLEINPLLAANGRIEALDALATYRE